MPRPIVLGLAVGGDVLVAHWRGGGKVRDWSRRLSDWDGPRGEQLRGALGELRAIVGVHERVDLAVAVLPPDARVRAVTLPPMTADDARSAIARAGTKHFVGMAEPLVCAVAKRRTTGEPVMAAAVSQTLLDDLAAALPDPAWRIARAVPAQAVWADEARQRWPELRASGGEAAAASGAGVSVLVFENDKFALVRRRPAGTTHPRMLGADAAGAPDAAGAALIAARGARRAGGFELLPDEWRAAYARAARRLATTFAAAAAACVVASAGVYRWGLARELGAIDHERAAIRPMVDRAMAHRDSLASLSGTAQAIDALERGAPRWSAVVGQIARVLPAQASLTAMRADGDSASLEGQAKDASEVFAALRAAPGITSVRPTAPIREDAVPGQPPVEHWVLTAQVAHAATTRGTR